MRIILSLFLMLLALFATAQSSRSAGNFTYTRLTAYSNLFTDAFSFGGNTASLATAKKVSAGLYSERRFNLQGLATHAAAFVLPTSSGNFGARVDYFGDAAYHEAMVGLAYARNMGERAALGLQFNYHNLGAAGYGAASTVSFDGGLRVRLTSDLNAGLQVSNPVKARWGKDGVESLPAVYRAGLGYDVSTQVMIAIEVEKVEDVPVGFNAGLQYQVAEKIITRAGIRSAASAYYFGFGLQLKRFRFDVTTSFHPFLGLSPGLLLLYSNPQ